MYRPISSAIGIVAAIVNRPQGLPVSALTTTSASTARMMIMIASTPTSASEPGIGPSSILIISPSDLPSRRTDTNRTMKSCTAPADHDAGEDPQRAGQVAHLRRQHRPDQRARAGDGREVVAVEHPLVGRHVVHAVVVPHRRRRPRIVEPQHLLGDELAVEAVGDEVDAERRRDQPHRVDAFAAAERQRGERERADDGDGGPDAERTRACSRKRSLQSLPFMMFSRFRRVKPGPLCASPSALPSGPSSPTGPSTARRCRRRSGPRGRALRGCSW